MWFWFGFGIWLAVGLATAVWMLRRGHSVAWLGLAALGPGAVPLALRARRREPWVRPRALHQGQHGTGGLDVLVGVDGSPESAAAIDVALAVAGRDLRRLVLACVVDFDSADSPVEDETRDAAAAELWEAVRSVSSRLGWEPDSVLLAGLPAEALDRYARDESCDLLVVGPTGRGGSRLLLGSVAAHLAEHASVPILVAHGRSTTRDDGPASDERREVSS